MQRSSVDLPEPEAPIRAIASCSRTVRSMPRRTWRSPKDLVTPRTSNTGVARRRRGVAHRAAPSGPPIRSTSRASGTVTAK